MDERKVKDILFDAIDYGYEQDFSQEAKDILLELWILAIREGKSIQNTP